MRTYAGVEQGAGEGDFQTYTIQILNKPHQILVSKVLNAFSILFPVNEVAELTVKPG